MVKERKIIHIDMDAFFAQIEQRDNPKYKNRPLIVGGPLNRGVISSASYEARKYGLHAGMPLSKAKRLCSDGIYVTVNMEKYLKESRKITGIFLQFTPLVETIGSDEGFLDVTGCQKLFGDAVEIAKKIKGKIYEQTNLTSSAGVAPNKFLAKLASGLGKPNGLTVLEKSKKVMDRIRLLPISYIWGVGRVTEKALNNMGINTIGELADTPLNLLVSKFGETGKVMHELANGIDNREVVPNREPKSVGRETTYSKDIDDPGILKSTLLLLSQKVSRNLNLKKYRGKTLTLKIRFADFKTITRSKTLQGYTHSMMEIYKASVALLKSSDLLNKKVRLIGISVSNLKPDYLLNSSLFSQEHKEDSLTEAIERISEKFGEDKITIAKIMGKYKDTES
ncbi:MAG: DNA polymerase IV [Candidatus Humimicrobiaceae bacterium]